MKKIKELKIIFLLFIPLSISAQSISDKEASKENVSMDTISFLDNTYVETNLATQILFSKDAGNLSGMERFTPSFSVTGGKWFNPSFGLSLNLQGFSLNGFSTVKGLYIADPIDGNTIYGNNDPVRNEVPIRPDGSYRQYIRYVNLHADFQLNVLNLLKDYNEQRRWDVIPSVGLGYMRVIEYKGIPNANIISTHFGLMGKYHLSDKIDINAALTSVIVPDQFEGRIAGKIYEGYCSLGFGFTYYFKNRGFKHPVSHNNPLQDAPVIKEVVVRDTVFVNFPSTTPTPSTEVAAPLKNEDPSIKTFNLSIIRFDSESVYPASGQELTLMNIAQFLQQHPTTKIHLEGYTDKQTGTASYNLYLAQQRAQNVLNLLVKKYGVEQYRLEIKALGSSVQPFKNSKWNRVVIAVAIDQ